MKIAIVTGATGNLGVAVVEKFLKEGYKVVGTFIRGVELPKLHSNEQYEEVTVDLSSEEDARQFVDSIIGKYGRIDVAVLTVGGFAKGTIAETATADILNQYKLNFETTYNVARPCFIQMMNQGSGRIFFIGSKPGLESRSGKGMVAYSLSKSLLFRLAELMNDEAKGKNIVTSVIVPSTIDTPQNRKSMPSAKFDNWVRPQQIAEIISFHSSESSLPLREPVIKIYNNA